MNAQTLIKDIWKGCTKKEMAGWLVFVGGFSLIAITQTVLWDMESDKLAVDLAVYRIIMAVFFTALSGMGIYLGYKSINVGAQVTKEDEFWRAFSGGLFFALLQVVFTLLELVISPLRGLQFYEYLQGVFSLGVATGCGMVWYLYAVGYVSKRKRETVE